MPQCADRSGIVSGAPVVDETTSHEISFDGELPAALRGTLLEIAALPAGPSTSVNHGILRALHLDGGRATAYRARSISTDTVAPSIEEGEQTAGARLAHRTITSFASSNFLLGDGTLALELDESLDPLRRVDLAGSGRGLTPHAKLDPATGELHLVAYAGQSEMKHVTVSAGGLTRTTRPIEGVPGRITDLAVTQDRIVVLTDGFIGLASRTGDADIAWIRIDAGAPRLVSAHDDGARVVVHAIGQGLERWILHPRSARIERNVLDATPQTPGVTNVRQLGEPHRFVWAVGEHTVLQHDLRAAHRDVHDFGAGHRLGPFVFVADPERRGHEDGGWLVGLIHRTGEATDAVVLDASVRRPVVATVHLPKPTPLAHHATWVPAT